MVLIYFEVGLTTFIQAHIKPEILLPQLPDYLGLQECTTIAGVLFVWLVGF
jgi:hypothetical protein